MSIRMIYRVLGTATALAQFGSAASAQDQSATTTGAQSTKSQRASSPGDTQAGLADIVVTANKNTSTAQRTPVAIAVVSGTRLSEAGVTNVADLIKVAPGIQFTPIRQKAIPFIRGVGQGISGGNADPAVAINFNDAYLPSEMSNLAFFDVDRVEVLYGPQGTLYGRNAVGGAINVITKRPGKTLGADITAELGNYGSRMATGGVNLPVSRALGIRIAGLRDRHDGYFSNGQSDADLWAVRGTALYEPAGGDTSVLLIGSYARGRGFGGGVQNLPPQTDDPWFLAFDPRSVPLFTRSNGGTASLQISHDFENEVKFTSISGYAKTDQHTNFTAFLNRFNPLLGRFDNIQYVDYTLRSTNYTQEFRLNGSSEKLNWLIGLYGYDASNAETSIIRAQLVPALALSVGPWEQHSHGAAIFGQLTYSLTPVFRLTGGARYSYDKKRLAGTNQNNFPGAPPGALLAYAGRRSDTRPDFKLGVEYDVAPRSLLYATFQTGYNNGGFSTAQSRLGPGVQPAATFEPLTDKSFIVGTKNRFLGGRLQLNAELFYNRFKNYQVSSRNLQTGQATVYNATKAETYGAQFDARAQISPNDELGVTVGLLHARFLTLIIPGGLPTVPPAPPAAPAINLSGRTMPLAPKVTANVDYTHSFPLASGARIDLAGNFRHVSGQWGVYNQLPGTRIKAYEMIDASLTYNADSGRWSLGAYVRNLTDKFTTAFTLGGATPGPASGFPLPPRTYGVRFAGHF